MLRLVSDGQLCEVQEAQSNHEVMLTVPQSVLSDLGRPDKAQDPQVLTQGSFYKTSLTSLLHRSLGLYKKSEQNP